MGFKFDCRRFVLTWLQGAGRQKQTRPLQYRDCGRCRLPVKTQYMKCIDSRSPMDLTMHVTPYTHLNDGIDLYDGNLMHAAHGKEALSKLIVGYSPVLILVQRVELNRTHIQ